MTADGDSTTLLDHESAASVSWWTSVPLASPLNPHLRPFSTRLDCSFTFANILALTSYQEYSFHSQKDKHDKKRHYQCGGSDSQSSSKVLDSEEVLEGMKKSAVMTRVHSTSDDTADRWATEHSSRVRKLSHKHKSVKKHRVHHGDESGRRRR